jgi:hypothetical protein
MYIARHQMTASRELAGEMIVISAGDSRLFTLNELGALVWTAADGVTDLRHIVETEICAEYDVPLAEAMADAEAFVRGLVEQGVMLAADEPIHMPADEPS